MKVNKAELLITAVKQSQYPEEGPLEIALAGRSNVGKSSLINTLINRKNLARTSSKPGKTQTINFYNINDQFRFVDLPGYGYAKVSLKERKKWGKMIENYLVNRKTLAEVFLLVDIRHSPGEHDKVMYDWIKSFGFNGIVIATKADKISRGKQAKHISMLQRELGVENRELIIPFSATKKTNKDKIWNVIKEILMVNSE
ncbi:ribosome biogenesis GTP-binding protein YihA/YsxC [Caldisalinibacter kiritimatiensis]|uniref:Probable GTP-binding protein EngB n=1 Tax=Caldisalinibacter kiritimatiensis TaxID=1304284 RepID=R1AR35_9FIRM|nr:ribosome biogenesis GTP-binding protein YihA/YsxC [Caldisalinibacter kiritimatiensis]EOC99607.1 GTP-binding protein EngB [Caldisalinibacter kiritimatiensis]